MPKFDQVIPILNVSDVSASLAFYTEVLGFEESWHWGHPPTFGGVRPARSVPGRTRQLRASTSRGIEQGPLPYALRQHRVGTTQTAGPGFFTPCMACTPGTRRHPTQCGVPQRRGPLLVLEEIGELAGAHLAGLGTGSGRVPSEPGEPLIDRRV